MQDMDKIWRAYIATKDPGLRETLIIEYAPLVKIIAGRLSIHIGQYVEYEDIISYGIFGLIDAIDKFEPSKGIKFETYASIRIRGSIIDNIRKLDWVPRTLRAKNKKLEKTYSDLTLELGHEPSSEELAEKLDISVEETQDLMRKSSVVSLVSLDDYLSANHEANPAESDGGNSLDKSIEEREVKKMLTDAIDQLGEKEKKVVMLYYFEELTLKEISAVLGVSESRVSQIHSKAVMLLQSKLGKYKHLLFS
ncbi:MAG: FliA/WhiG family RNA polymerase sigma factor [Clostridiales bacterium]|jgi:RNA polymerase sigma factor for flagellar operon FliA|nr:FliA/WhiG family RNA polymerase sigma factor [Clostridiales bacterium]